MDNNPNIPLAQRRDEIVFAEVNYDSDIATQCLNAFAEEVSTRLGIPFDLETSGDPDLSQMQHPHGTFIIAILDDTPLGCVGIKGDGGTIAEVKRMWIAPEARRLGLARRMMIAAEDAARTLGITTLRLDTNSTLVEAIQLYETMGWTPTERFNDNPYPDRFFQKAL